MEDRYFYHNLLVFINNPGSNLGLRRREGAIRWKSASGCHYNCISPGSGIRLVMNKKLGKSSIQLCQPEQYVTFLNLQVSSYRKRRVLQGCGKVKTPFQHASMICSKYKDRVRRLSGLGMQISPSLGRFLDVLKKTG